MTYKDAFEILEALDRNKLSKKLRRLAIKALKKRVPSMPDNLNEDTRNCPSCGYPYDAKCNYHFCPNCGQAVDWSVYEEET